MMNAILKKRKQLVVVDFEGKDWQHYQHQGVVFCQDREDIGKTMKELKSRSCWISCKRSGTDDLLRKMQMSQHRRGRIFGLVNLESPRPESIDGLCSHFRRLVGIAPKSALLPMEELLDVLSAPIQEVTDVFIAGVVDMESETLTLTRANLRTITVPFSMFTASGKGVEPDFTQLSIIDYGHTVRLGQYEASSDSILYEIEPEYRRKIRKRRIAEEKTFGASLRRLRIQKKLSRKDFEPLLSAKTVARIERGEVEKPHGETLQKIADRLEIEPEDIETY
jgi:DNA-binding Xre family transcriptional regulator